MARTKGARGKKNIPTNQEFIGSLKQLSDKFLKRLDVIAMDPRAEHSIVIRAAALIIGEAMTVIKHEEFKRGENVPIEHATPIGSSEPNRFAKLVDFGAAKEDSDKKKASK